MPIPDLLAAIYERVVGVPVQAGAVLDELAQELVDHFDDAVASFVAEAEEALANDPASLPGVHQTFVTFVTATFTAGIDVDNRLRRLFTVVAGLTAGRDDGSSLLAALFGALGGDTERLLRALRAFIAALDDYPAFFANLVMKTAIRSHDYRRPLEELLLPLVAAALSMSDGTGLVARAFQLVLHADSSAAAERVTVFEIGLPELAVAGWSREQLRTEPFRLRRVAWLVALLLENLRAASGLSGVLPGAVAPNPGLNATFQPIAAWCSGIVNGYLAQLSDAITQLVLLLLQGAEQDPDLEWSILELARFTPVGILFVLVAMPWKLLTSPAPYLNLLFNPIEHDSSQKVLRLPAPGPDRPYMILSDIHRDPKSDAMPEFEPGSIDHYLENRELYAEVIQSLDERGYTIIEAGDCEELWFHRDFTRRPAQRLQAIIDTHADLYARLARLHREGRYFRIRGNHDSYLSDPAVLAVLQSVMDPAGDAPFEVFDFIILDGIKTMHDIPIYVGLDSDPNAERKPLIITHGHQWDFWNCDANNILGKMIVSAVVTPLDMLDDPLRDVGGISSYGSPSVNFADIMAGLLVFSGWPAYEPAVKLLDRIQHMPDADRRLTDDVMYSETLASLMGLLIPVAARGGDACTVPFPGGMCLFNLMSIGHTHNPHNEPYYDLEMIPKVGELIGAAEDAVNGLTGGLLATENFSLVKSNFLNSGVSGWCERCVWGIDLGEVSHGTGQPKLVSWTHNTRPDRPHEMDWELPHRPRGGAVAPGDRIVRTVQELSELFLAAVEAAASEAGSAVEAQVRKRLRGMTVSLPVARILPAMASSRRINLAAHFDKPGTAGRGAVHSVVAQIAAGLLDSLNTGVPSAFAVEVIPPRDLWAELSRLERQNVFGKALKGTDPLVNAIGVLAALHEVCAHGLAKTSPLVHLGQDGEKRECLGLLLILATLVRGGEGATDRLDVTLHKGERAIEARINIRGAASKQR